MPVILLRAIGVAENDGEISLAKYQRLLRKLREYILGVGYTFCRSRVYQVDALENFTNSLYGFFHVYSILLYFFGFGKNQRTNNLWA